MKKIHIISPEELSFEKIDIILKENYKLQLSDKSIHLINKCRNYLDEKMKNQKEPIYGITTGFGSLCNHSISENQLSQLQENLVMSHACGTGDFVPKQIVKIMMLLKVHALSLGHSGVQLITVQRIIDMFNNSVIPVVFQQGSLGASGDLVPLAHLFLPLIGKGEVFFEGKRQNAEDILRKFNWEPIKLQSKEGLALLNGTQFMSSFGVYSILKAKRISQFADIVGTISLEAYDGRIEPFTANLHTIRPHNGQIETAENFRNLLSGSEIIIRQKKHVQDPYSFRCIPQVHGATKDTINYVSSVLLTEINSVTDNPTVFPDEDMILSGGNFHGQPMALIFDFLSIAIAELGSISERRVYRLISGNRGLPEFLVANPGLNSGFMIAQYSAASIVSQNKQLCTPSSVDSIPSSNEQEDHVSMGANGATKLYKVVNNVEKIIAIELFNAAQALEFRKPQKTSEILNNFVCEYRKFVNFVDDDRILYFDIENSIKFLKEYQFKNK